MNRDIALTSTRHTWRHVLSLFLAVTAVLAVAAVACSTPKDVASGLAIEEACKQNSDCASGLICALGACRAMCATAVDCQAGGACISSGRVAVCQYAAEKNSPCNKPTDCPAPLACASDYRCRNLCTTATDCNVLGITERVCGKDAQGVAYCADPSEVSGGLLIAKPPANAHTSSAVVEPDGGDGALIASRIGPLGGTLGIGGVSVAIPAGALDQEIVVSITPIAAPFPGSVGQAYEIGPTGTQFKLPIAIAFAYTLGQLGGQPPAGFAVSTVAGNAWQALSSPALDPDALTISGTTMHLSPYALVAQPARVFDGGDGGGTIGDGGGPHPLVVGTGVNCPRVGELTVGVLITATVTWPATAATNGGSGSYALWLLSTYAVDSQNNITSTTRTCQLVTPSISLTATGNIAAGLAAGVMGKTGVQSPVSEWEKVTRTSTATGVLGAWNVGSSIYLAPAVSLYGLKDTSPYKDPTTTWPPSSAAGYPFGMTPDFVAEEGDGNPGVDEIPITTAGYAMTRTGLGGSQPAVDRIYIASRTELSLYGTSTSCTDTSGTAIVTLIDSHVIGCNVENDGGTCAQTQWGFIDSNRTVFVPGAATFTQKVLTAGASCSDVVAAVPGPM